MKKNLNSINSALKHAKQWPLVAVAICFSVVIFLYSETMAGYFWSQATLAASSALAWTKTYSAALLGAILIALGVFLLSNILIYVLRKFHFRQHISALPRKALLPDTPINLKVEDQFGYDLIAEKLHPFLCLKPSSPSIVFSINDRWGSGKTSTLNLLKSHLRLTPEQPVIVEFSPWLVGSKQSLIHFFLLQFAAAINDESKNDSLEEVADAYKQILEMADYLPVELETLPGLGKVSAKTRKGPTAINEVTLSEQKRRVNKSLKKLSRPIIVVIDDLDRLTGKELLVVFQMIKAVCDFPGVLYVLAMDHELVAKRIAERINGDGQSYLEKIIQADVSLPPLTITQQKNHLSTIVHSACTSNDIKLSDEEREALPDALLILSRVLQTPRDATRFINRLLINLTEKHVFFPDRLVYEAIYLKFPLVAAEIRRFPARYASYGIPAGADGLSVTEQTALYLESREKKKEATPTPIPDELRERISNEERIIVERCLKFLFPKFAGYLGYDEIQASTQDRAAHYPALLVIINASGNGLLYSAQDVDLLLSNPRDGFDILRMHVINAGGVPDFLSYIKIFLANRTLKEPEEFAEILLRFSDIAFREHGIRLADDTASVLLSLFPTNAPRPNLLNFICANTGCLSATERLILEILRSASLWDAGIYSPQRETKINASAHGIPLEEIRSAVATWIKAMDKRASEHNLFIVEENPLSLLFRWGQMSQDFSRVRIYVDSLLKLPTNIDLLLQIYNGISSVQGVENIVSDLSGLLESARSQKDKFPKAFRELADYIPTKLN